MNRNVFLCLLLLLFTFSFKGYSQSADITEGCIGMKVQFSAPGPGSWDFGDGKSSGLSNPQITYSKAGTYTVKFNGNPTGIIIKVSPKPEIVITASPTKGCVPLNVVFNASLKNQLPTGVTINNASIVWNYQDGNNSSNTLNPNYTYTKAGLQDLGFFMTFNQNGSTACSKIDTLLTKLIKTTDKPTVNFTPSALSSCTAPLNVSFINTSTSTLPITYKWDFGNGKSSTKQNGDAQNYTKDGKYNVKLVVTDNNECSDSMTKIINIGKPLADFQEQSNRDTTCIPNEYNHMTTLFFLNKSTPGIYTWKFDAGASIATSNLETPGPINYYTPGKHKITLTVNANGCVDDTTMDIYVQDPTISIGINRSYSCRDTLTSFYKITNQNNSGPVASYYWTFPSITKTKKATAFPSNTNTATPKCFYNTFDSTYTVRGVNIDTVYCQYITKAGCLSNIAITVDTISEMWARIIPDIHEGCKDLNVTFTDISTSHLKSTIDVWQWDFGDGTKQTLNAQSKPIHTYKTPGIYYATLIVKDNDYNCSDTSWKTEIHVGDSILPIDFTLSSDTICRGESVYFKNTTDLATQAKITAWNYSSDKEHLSSCFQYNEGNFLFNDSIGKQTITLSAEYNGCYVSKSHTLEVKGPIAHFDYLQDCKTPTIIKLINKAEGSGTVSWNIGGNIIPANPDTTIVDLSTFVPTLNFGDLTIKQIIKGGVCGDDSTGSIVHYGIVKSIFNITDTSGNILNPVNGNVLLGDASTGQKYKYDAQNSNDIYANDCYRGFTFLQEGNRPRVWTLAKDSVLVFKNDPNGADNQVVKIIARNQNNCVDTSKINIRIFDLDPKFTFTTQSKITNNDTTVTSVCLPVTLKFNGGPSTADTTIKTYTWKFSDGGSGTGKIISHTFNPTNSKNDSLFITLTITDVNGFSKSYLNFIPTYKPSIQITAIPSINPEDSTVYICAGNNVLFNATSTQKLTYKWTYENGFKTFTSNSTSPKFYVPSGKTSNTEKVIVDFVETATGCVGQTYRKINTEIYPTPIILSNVVNGIGCGNPSFNANFKDSSFFNPTFNTPCYFLWNLGVNNTSSSNSTASFTYEKGKYSVGLTLTTQANGCTKDTTLKFEVVSPTANFTINKNDICQGEELIFTMINPSPDVKSYRWDFGDGVIDSLNNPTKHTYNYVPPSGKTVATLFVQNNGCSNPYFQDVNMHYVHADFAVTDLGSYILNDTVTCLGDAFSFTNTSENSDIYKWEYDNNTSITKDIDSYTFPKTDTFNIHLFVSNNAYGCKDDTIKQVIVSKKPSVKGIIEPICKGIGTVKLSTKDTLTNHIYTWSPSNLTPSKNTIYTVTVNDTINHCSSTDDVLAVVIEDINPISWDTTIIIGEKVKLPIDNQNSTINFTWKPSDGLSCLQCAYPITQPLKDIIYTVLMKDNNNCGFTNNGVFKITVKPETHLKLPTTFTPNGDGINDVIYVKGWGVKSLETFEIYNRWGELIFKTNNIEDGWDGFYKGELQNNDVYAYKVIGTSWKLDPSSGQDAKLIKEGYIHLMR